MAYLIIENLKKNFSSSSGTLEVLKDVGFSVGKGEVVSVIGPSGGGKTTLLRCMNFLEKTDGGTMILDGETLIDEEDGEKRFKEKYLRKKRMNFGLVFQQYNLFPHLTVGQNIKIAPTLLLKDEIKAYRKKEKDGGKRAEYRRQRRIETELEAKELLNKVGLLEKENEYPCSLSGGQEQRAAIARALALKPKILCFDEPTSALDPSLTGEVLKVIKRLKEDGTTMVIVTHDMEFAKAVSDRVIFMNGGRVIEEGSPDTIFERPQTEELKAFLNNYGETE